MKGILRATGAFAIGLACAAAAHGGQFVYVSNYNSNSISGFRMDTGGTLTSIGSPAATGVSPWGLATHPSGRFLYAGNAVSGDISAYKIEDSGALTMLGAPYPVGPRPFSVAVDTTGEFLYAALEGSAQIVAYRLNASGSIEAPLGSFATGSTPQSIIVSPAGGFLYVANVNGGTIGAYAIGSDGRLTVIGEAAAGVYPWSLGIDPAGKFLYAANRGSQNVSMFAIGPTGALRSLGTPVGAGPYPSFAAVEPLGRFLYVGSEASTVYAYAIQTEGTLTLISPSQLSGSGGRPVSMVFDPTGSFAYVANRDFNNVVSAHVLSDGTLFATGTYGAGSTPLGLATNRCTPAASLSGKQASPALLWPPNHQMVPVTVDYEVSDRCGAAACTLSVTSSDPVNPNAPDWLVLSPHLVQLRAKRAGGSEGRVYTIKIVCTDPSGNSVSAGLPVVVPPNRGQ